MKPDLMFVNDERVRVTRTGLSTTGMEGNVVSSRASSGRIFVTVRDDYGNRYNYNQNSLEAVLKAPVVQAKSGPAKLPHCIVYSDDNRWAHNVTAEDVRRNVVTEQVGYETRMGSDALDLFESNEEYFADAVDNWEHVFVIYPDGHVERLVKPKTRYDIERLP